MIISDMSTSPSPRTSSPEMMNCRYNNNPGPEKSPARRADAARNRTRRSDKLTPNPPTRRPMRTCRRRPAAGQARRPLGPGRLRSRGIVPEASPRGCGSIKHAELTSRSNSCCPSREGAAACPSDLSRCSSPTLLRVPFPSRSAARTWVTFARCLNSWWIYANGIPSRAKGESGPVVDRLPSNSNAGTHEAVV